MCRIDETFSRNPDIMWKQLGDQIVTLHLKTHTYHVLNEAAALIFERSTGSATVEEVGRDLAGRFKINKGQALEDTRETVDGMVKLGLLVGKEVKNGAYSRPAVKAITEDEFKGAIASGAKLACRSLLGA